MLGDWVNGCRWADLLVKYADSMVSVSMIERIRYAHQVNYSLCFLFENVYTVRKLLPLGALQI